MQENCGWNAKGNLKYKIKIKRRLEVKTSHSHKSQRPDMNQQAAYGDLEMSKNNKDSYKYRAQLHTLPF